MSKKASEFQEKTMSLIYRGKARGEWLKKQNRS